MNKDLETAARERALAMHLASIVGMYFPREVETHFNSGFLAGAAHNQKRIEELEAKVEQYANNILIHDKRATGHLRDYNLERQISKMLEEGLDRIWNCETLRVNDCPLLAEETLSEVQKLRGVTNDTLK